MPDLTLGGNLPQSVEQNGLLDWTDQFINDATDIGLVAIVKFDVQKLVTTVYDGTVRPVLRLAWIEPVGRLEVVPDDVRRLVVDLRAQRTGGDPLPFDPIPTVDGTPAYATGPDDDPARAAHVAPKGRARAKNRKNPGPDRGPDAEESTAAAIHAAVFDEGDPS